MTTPYIEEVQVLRGKKHGKIALSVGIIRVRERGMRKTIEEIVEAIEELYASGKYDAEFRKKLITNSIQARDEALLAELEEEVKSLWEDETRLQSSVTFNHALKRVLSLISSKRMK